MMSLKQRSQSIPPRSNKLINYIIKYIKKKPKSQEKINITQATTNIM